MSVLDRRHRLEQPVPYGDAGGIRLVELLDEIGAEEWVSWALRRPIGWWPDEFEEALFEACRELDRRRGAR